MTGNCGSQFISSGYGQGDTIVLVSFETSLSSKSVYFDFQKPRHNKQIVSVGRYSPSNKQSPVRLGLSFVGNIDRRDSRIEGKRPDLVSAGKIYVPSNATLGRNNPTVYHRGHK